MFGRIVFQQYSIRLKGALILISESCTQAQLEKADEEIRRREGVDEELAKARESLEASLQHPQGGAVWDLGGSSMGFDGENQGEAVRRSSVHGEVPKPQAADEEADAQKVGELQQGEDAGGQPGDGDDLLEYYKGTSAKMSKEIKGLRDERDAIFKDRKELLSKVEGLEKRWDLPLFLCLSYSSAVETCIREWTNFLIASR